MRRSKGFTLIELMVVILIVAILAAVLAPMMTGRINSAKWTEGRAGAGTIVTALRAFAAENEGIMTGVGALSGAGGFVGIGITDGDLAGKYFNVGSYVASYTMNGTVVATITVTVTAPAGLTPPTRTLTVTIPLTGLATTVWNPP
jgi:prepilin-type N-terminal cleavage/methylation domain-containing protein